MADWGQRAKDKDRDEAIRVIEDAAARGQIVDVDKQKRIQDVRAAGTVGEIEQITRGVAAAPAAPVDPGWATSSTPPPVSAPGEPVAPTFQPYQPPTTPPVAEPDPTPPPSVPYGEPLTPSLGTAIPTPPMVKRGGHGGKLVLIVVLIVLAGIAVPVFIGIKSLVDTVQDGIEEIDGIGDRADTFSADGFADLLSDLEEETGSTEIFDATLYPEYAVVQVPAEPTGQRMFRYYWDGDLELQSKGKSTAYPDRMDLSTLDIDVVERLRTKIRAKVEDSEASSSYVIVHAPGTSDEGASLYAYASNDFSEGGYVAATIDGKIVRTTTW